MQSRHWCFAAAAIAVFAAAPTASQAQGFDNDGIAISRGLTPGPGGYYPTPPGRRYHYWDGPFAAAPYPYAYGCPRRAVRVQLPNGRFATRWIRSC